MSTPNLCCCCSLKTGTIIIGVLDIIGGIILIIGSIVALGVGATIKGNSDGTDEHDAAVLTMVMYIIAGVFLVLGIVTIVFGALLLYANRKESTYLMKVWMIYKVVELVIIIVCSILKYTSAFSAQEALKDCFSVGFILWYLATVHFRRKEIKLNSANTAAAYSTSRQTA